LLALNGPGERREVHFNARSLEHAKLEHAGMRFGYSIVDRDGPKGVDYPVGVVAREYVLGLLSLQVAREVGGEE
jgi:hypothetical protein